MLIQTGWVYILTIFAIVPPEQRASYSAIIDDILSKSDLNVISAKQIRKGLQAKVDYDLTPQKDEIKELIMERFDKVQNEQEDEEKAPEPAPTANGLKPQRDSSTKSQSRTTSPPATKRKADESEELSEVVDSPPPKKVKKKAIKPEAESDEAYAARLQAELNSVQGRLTRGGGPKRKPPVKKEKKTKKKSSAKVRAEDDSELSGSGSEEPVKKTGGFNVSRATISMNGAQGYVLTCLFLSETHAALRAPCDSPRRVLAFATANREANMGAHQGE